jgi:hypothetical protein
MRLRTLLAATAAGTLTLGLVGAVGVPAHSVTAPPTADAGALVTWGDAANPNGGEAIPVPADLSGPVRSVAANAFATGVVTADGGVRVWGKATRSEVAFTPTDITDATAIAMTAADAAVLRADGRITAWGDSVALSEVPDDLRAQAIALQTGTGWAVRPDGTLATWGAPATVAPPADLTNLVDVSAALSHVLALRGDGTVATWGITYQDLLQVPDFGARKVVKVASGMLYSGVILDDGTISVWGPQKPAGQPTFDGQSPAGTVVDLALGAGNAFAVTADGAVHHWGANTNLAVPETLTGQHTSAVAVGTTHAAAVVVAFRELAKPTIAGAPKVGETLTATPAELSLEPDAPATGQWLADGEPIDGQTGTTLTLDEALLGKTITYRTTATRGDETIESTSDAVGPVTPATVASTTKVAIRPATSAYGAAKNAIATVSAAGATPTGKVTFALGSRRATRSLVNGKATWALPRTLAVGRHRVTATYAGNTATEPSKSAAATVTVRKATSRLNAAANYLKRKRKALISAKVRTTAGANASGTVRFVLKRGKRTVATKRDGLNRRDVATVTFKGRQVRRPGTYRVIAVYLGSRTVKASTDVTRFRVRR